MQLTRSRELTVRMGEYESFKFSATVVATHHDLGLTDEQMLASRNIAGLQKELQALVAEQLDLALQTDMEDADALTGDRKSFIRRAFASATATATATTKKKD